MVKSAIYHSEYFFMVYSYIGKLQMKNEKGIRHIPYKGWGFSNIYDNPCEKDTTLINHDHNHRYQKCKNAIEQRLLTTN